MKRNLILVGALLCLTLSSCNNSGKTNEAKADTEIVSDSILQVNTLLVEGDNYAGKTVVTEGICSHICKHGGAKMFLMGNTEEEVLRIESSEATGKFKPEVVGAMVKVEGTLVEERIDENYLLEWEEELKAEMEKHGESESGCATEKAARKESAEANTPEARIADFRKRIAERKAKEGKDYLSFFHMSASKYEIMK